MPNRKQIIKELKSKNYNKEEQHAYKLMRYNYEFRFYRGWCEANKMNTTYHFNIIGTITFLKEYYPEYLV